MHSSRADFGPADWIDPSNLPAPIPWTYYHDATKLIFAPSQNGARPTKWRKLHPWGNTPNLYDQVPRIWNGVHDQYNPQVSDDVLLSQVPNMKQFPPPDGPRGVCVVNPFVTWHGHPSFREDGTYSARLPLFVGIRVDGMLMALMRDGSVINMGLVPGVSGALDFSYYPPNRKIFFVADAFNGRILKVDRTAAIAAQKLPAFEDSSLWATTVFSTGFRKLVSLRCLTDGTMYAVDQTLGALYRISATGIATKLLDIPTAFFLDYQSDGKLVVVTDMSQVYIIDPANPVLGPNLMPTQFTDFDGTFLPVSVDRNGTIGPKDEFYICRPHGVASTDFWRFSADGSIVTGGAAIFNPGGRTTVGDTVHTIDTIGHYPWVAECHPDQGVLLAQGYAAAYPALLRPAQPEDVPEDVYDHGSFVKGETILRMGTVAGEAFGSLPSFTCLIDPFGWSLLGCTADYVSEMSYDAADKFIRQGMIGSFPRPNMTAHDVFCVQYCLRRNSQRFLREGKALMDGLRAYYAGMAIGPSPSYPQIDANVYAASVFIEPRMDSTQFNKTPTPGAIRVTFTDGSRLPHDGYVYKAPDPSVVIEVTADKGTTNEKIIGTVGSPWLITNHGLPSGQHSLFSRVVSGAAKQYLQQSTIVVV
jgi:hypothetical protein